MSSKLRVFSPEQLMDGLLALLEEAESVPLVISGNSMVPFLVHGRDTVYLSKITREPKRGDMILYLRDSGEYILHRVCKVKGGVYSLIGDAHPVVERGIRRDQIKALVVAVRRKERLLKKGSFVWWFFEKVWLWLIPLRPLVIGIYTRFLKNGRDTL